MDELVTAGDMIPVEIVCCPGFDRDLKVLDDRCLCHYGIADAFAVEGRERELIEQSGFINEESAVVVAGVEISEVAR